MCTCVCVHVIYVCVDICNYNWRNHEFEWKWMCAMVGVGEGRRYENNINIVLTYKILKIINLNEKVQSISIHSLSTMLIFFYIMPGTLSMWLLNSPPPILVSLLYCIHNFGEIKSLSPVYQTRLERQAHRIQNKWSFTQKNFNWLEGNWI